MNEIEQALTRIFGRHRIVFWYDARRELRGEYEAVSLPDVTKVELDHNEFAVKHRVLRVEPERKFLLYHAGPPPPDLENWLLDVQLAQGQFRADQLSLWLAEVGLGFEFAEVIAPHAPFFQAARRRWALRDLLAADDTPRRARQKMLAVCAQAGPRVDEIAESLLDELAQGNDEKASTIERCALDGFLWQELERAYGYRSEQPGMRDFCLTLFQACYAMGVGEPAELNPDALVFVNRWKDSVRHRAAFEALSAACAQVLPIEQDLQGRALDDLAAVDLYALIDQRILSDLVQAVTQRTMAGAEVERWVRQRRTSHWYERYRHAYSALHEAAAFGTALEQADLNVPSFAGGIERYAGSWYLLDQHYRKFVYHARQSGQATLLDALLNQVGNLYSNAYLLKLNDRWQAVVDGCETWDGRPAASQREFYEKQVLPFVGRGHKVVVLISDGMRYEIGEELLRLIRQEDRYDADLVPAWTPLPSYTQLGMAALLPHERLALDGDGSTVLVDGASSVGTENRNKILDRALEGATALRAEDVLAMNREACRALLREHDVIYLYHNRIDAVGDKRDSEERVFDAVEAALEELVLLVKKLANANASNLLITADHGFIYQHQSLDESDYASQEPQGDQIQKRQRRFVLGKGLRESGSFTHWHAGQLGLDGDTELLIPKSINRLRLQGAGSRYVHGGAALQEVVIPVLKVNKRRESDVRRVEVDLIRSASSVLSTGQLTVVLYQTEPATAKVQPRHLQVGLYTQDGVLISDAHRVIFDLASENPRDREQRVTLTLTRDADRADGQEVILRLDEPVEGTTHVREYKSTRYLYRRTFTSDFDF